MVDSPVSLSLCVSLSKMWMWCRCGRDKLAQRWMSSRVSKSRRESSAGEVKARLLNRVEKIRRKNNNYLCTNSTVFCSYCHPYLQWLSGTLILVGGTIQRDISYIVNAAKANLCT